MAATVRKASAAANVVFSVSGITVTGTIVQGYDDTFASDLVETPDASGETVAAAYFNAKRDITVEALYNSASEVTFAPGDALTVNSLAGFIKSIQRKKASTEFYKLTIVVTFYAANTLT